MLLMALRRGAIDGRPTNLASTSVKLMVGAGMMTMVSVPVTGARGGVFAAPGGCKSNGSGHSDGALML